MAIASVPSSSRTGVLLVRGGSLRVLSMTINMAGTFLLLPFMVYQLGDYWYGVWALIGAVIVQYHILDFGLSQTVVRFIARFRAERAPEQAAAVFSTALAAFSAFGAITFAGVVAAAASTGAWGFPPEEARILAAAVLMAGATMCCAFPTYAVEGCFAGALRQDIPSLLQLLRTILRLSMTYYFMAEGYSIAALAAISLGCDTLYRLQLLWLLPRYVPEARFRRRAVSRACLGEMLRFGRYVFLTNIARYSVIHASTIVAGVMVGVAATTTYAIALNIIERLEGMVRMALFLTMPAFTGIAAERGESGLLVERFLMVSRIAAFGVSIVCGGLIVAGHPFVSAWMGPAYAAAYWPLAILAAAWMADLAQVPAMQVLTALGRHKRFAQYDAIVAASSLALAVGLAPSFGLAGIAAGVALPVLVSGLVLKPLHAARALSIPVRRVYAATGRVMLGCLAMQTPVAAALHSLTPLGLGELALFGLLAYCPLALAAGLCLLPAADQRYLLGLLPGRFADPIRRVLPHLRQRAGRIQPVPRTDV